MNTKEINRINMVKYWLDITKPNYSEQLKTIYSFEYKYFDKKTMIFFLSELIILFEKYYNYQYSQLDIISFSIYNDIQKYILALYNIEKECNLIDKYITIFKIHKTYYE